MSTKRKSVDLRTFVTKAVSAIPSRQRRNPEARYNVVVAAMEAARKGTIRKLDGTRYAETTARTKTYTLFNEIVG